MTQSLSGSYTEGSCPWVDPPCRVERQELGLLPEINVVHPSELTSFLIVVPVNLSSTVKVGEVKKFDRKF